MRFSILMALLAGSVMMTGASADPTKVTGTQAFCAVHASNANCSFDTAAACEKGIANMGTAGSASYRCSERSKLDLNQ